MAKHVVFHADSAQVTIIVGGVPVAVRGEVDVVVKQPAKMGMVDSAAWDEVTQKSAQGFGAEFIPVAGG